MPVVKGPRRKRDAPAGKCQRILDRIHGSAASEKRSQLRISPANEQLWKEANDGHHNFKACLRHAIKDHARRAGDALNELKKRLGHGNWLAVLKDKFQGSRETAQSYMRVARRWGEIVAAGLDRDGITLEELKRFLAKPKKGASTGPNGPRVPSPEPPDDGIRVVEFAPAIVHKSVARAVERRREALRKAHPDWDEGFLNVQSILALHRELPEEQRYDPNKDA
jgi:hypothetical protein